MTAIQWLSDELLLIIFEYAAGEDVRALGRLAQVSVHWRELCHTASLRRRFHWELVCAGQVPPLSLRRDWSQALFVHGSKFVTVTHPLVEVWDCRRTYTDCALLHQRHIKTHNHSSHHSDRDRRPTQDQDTAHAFGTASSSSSSSSSSFDSSSSSFSTSSSAASSPAPFDETSVPSTASPAAQKKHKEALRLVNDLIIHADGGTPEARPSRSPTSLQIRQVMQRPGQQLLLQPLHNHLTPNQQHGDFRFIQSKQLPGVDLGNITKVRIVGESLLFTVTANSFLCVWDLHARPAALTSISRVPCHPGNLVDMDVHASTLVLVTAAAWGEASRLLLWRVDDQGRSLTVLAEKTLTASRSASVMPLAVTRDDIVYAANATARGSISVLDASEREPKVLSCLQLSKTCVISMAVNESVLATAVRSRSSGDCICLWDICNVRTAPLTCVAKLPCAASRIAANSHAIFAAGDESISVWHLSKPDKGTGRRVVTHRGSIHAPWSPGRVPLIACSQELLVAFFDSHIHVWPTRPSHTSDLL